MSSTDLKRVVRMLDAVLEVFGSYRDRLKVSEVRLLSMFAALRMDLTEELEKREAALTDQSQNA